MLPAARTSTAELIMMQPAASLLGSPCLCSSTCLLLLLLLLLLLQCCRTRYTATGVHILLRVGEAALDIAASQLLAEAPQPLTDTALAVAEAAVDAATARVAAAVHSSDSCYARLLLLEATQRVSWRTPAAVVLAAALPERCSPLRRTQLRLSKNIHWKATALRLLQEQEAALARGMSLHMSCATPRRASG
jgi:hypothetical protein